VKQVTEKWRDVEARLMAGDVPSVFVNPGGFLCIDGGVHGGVHGGDTIPAALTALFPAHILEAAKVKSDSVAAEKKAELAARMAEASKRWRALDLRQNEEGFVLIAGEDSEIVADGTLLECRTSLYKVCRQPRDSYAGRGCWTISDSSGIEVQIGEFDENTYW
jgi:hypothetical protein